MARVELVLAMALLMTALLETRDAVDLEIDCAEEHGNLRGLAPWMGFKWDVVVGKE